MINLIAAVAKNGVIGRNGTLPWDFPEDRAYFRRLTRGGALIMGRRTFAEIGHPLPDRATVIVSRTLRMEGENLHTACSLDEAIRMAELLRPEIFLCGGAEIYRQGMVLAERLYLTEIEDAYEGDVYFPAIPEGMFRLKERVHSPREKLWYAVYER